MSESVRKEKVYLPYLFFPAKLCILPNRNLQSCEKPIRIEYLIKQKPRGALALQIKIGSLTC